MGIAARTAAIVAGGRATRFGGRDKSRLDVGGRPIIVRQVEVLQRVAGRILVVGGDPARYADLPVTAHADVVSGAGAIGGVYSALELAATDLVIVVACDLPFLDAAVLERLCELAGAADGAWVRTAAGVEPLVACYQRRVRARIREAIDAGRLKLADLADALAVAELAGDDLARYGDPARLVTNVNTPGEYERIQ
jgi:molybdopterin-guanine dinucleotide biosynthesis protein A